MRGRPRSSTRYSSRGTASTCRAVRKGQFDVTVDAATVILRLPTKSITFPAECAPALRAVLDGGPVSAGSLPGLDVDDGLVVLRRLLREAVLVAL